MICKWILTIIIIKLYVFEDVKKRGMSERFTINMSLCLLNALGIFALILGVKL